MHELIKIEVKDGKQLVSARELHKGLQIQTPFRSWFPRMCEYGFEQNIDYTPYIFVHPQNKQNITDYVLTLDMAKEISMIQRNDLGKKFRTYFIECEKQLKQISIASYMISDPIERAQKWIEEEKVRQKLALQIEQDKPKIDRYEALMNTKNTYTATQMAKCYGLSSAIKLNKLLNANEICYKQGKSWQPYAHVDKSWYKVVVNEFGSQLRFTGVGVVEISKLLNVKIEEKELEEVIQ